MYPLFFRIISISVISILSFFFQAEAQKWNLYSSFDNNPVKIIDSPEKTYFLVHQQSFDKTQQGYDFPSLALFEYDKAHHNDGISALISRVGMSGADVRLAEYSPAGDYLFIGYDSGMIDIVNPDGAVTTVDALTHSSLPGGSIINSVTFDQDSGDAWIATDAGYMHIEAASRNVAAKAAMDKTISWIARVGDRLLAVSDGQLYESKGVRPHSFNDFSNVEGIGNVIALLPLSDTCAAYLSGNIEGNISVIALHKNGEKWESSTLGSDYFRTMGKNGTVTHRYECNVIPNRDGYMLYSGDRIWQLTRGTQATPPSLHAIQMAGFTLPIGSWDMHEFWGYKDRGMFQRHHAAYERLSAQTSVTWETVGEPLRPNAPASFISTYINYSPAYGQLLVNHGQAYEFINNIMQTPVLLSGKKGDHWTVYSQLYNIPRSVEENPGLKRIFDNTFTRFPVSDPQGLAVDPVNPNWVACGSMFGGLFLMDLSDPKKDVIHFAAPNDHFQAFPGFVSTTPRQEWETLSLFSNPEFDSDGRMWAFCGNPFEAGGPTEPEVSVRFITADQRKAFYEADTQNYSSLKSWTTIGLPLDKCTSWDRLILCGNHVKNKNRVFAFTSGNSNALIILDHHGHPEDTAQIDFQVVTHLEDVNGWSTQLRFVSSVAEDPSTGDIIIASLDGLFIIEAGAEGKDGIIRGRHLTLRNGSPGDIVPTEAHIFKVIFDDEGRMWIGSRNMGIVGVNRERTEVIARYNTSNSPIPSDWVTGIGWNPDTRSLMVSTHRGLAEVFPDLPESSALSSTPVLNMTAVSPDYNGAVEIRNLPANLTIIIKDSEGREIRRIDNGSATIAEWDLRDSTGQSSPSGIYTICINGLPPLELTLMR